MRFLKDRKEQILAAALATLREHGANRFTQARVAARAGLRQSHLTYYFGTRLALLKAVARVAIDEQFAAMDKVLAGATLHSVAKALADISVRQDGTRVLLALVQAADQDPALRELFRELAEGIALRMERFLKRLNVLATQQHAHLLYALCVGLATVDLATRRPRSKHRGAAILETTFSLMTAKAKA